MNNDDEQTPRGAENLHLQLMREHMLEQSLADDPNPAPLMVPEPDYGTADYICLPDFGAAYYSLTDAALVAALDMWSSDEVPGVSCDDEPYEHDGPELRKALEPLRSQLVTRLVRSVEAGQLDAKVLKRNFSDSRLIPERTYVLLEDAVEWLEVHGHERGDFIEKLQESHDLDPWRGAAVVAEARARLRHPVTKRDPQGDAAKPFDNIGERVMALERDLEAAHLHVIHLERAKAGAGGDDKRVTTRERRTLLTIIAALCKKAGIDPASRGAAVAIASATAELGSPVSDDSIRTMLRHIPDATDSRSR